jgi:hypothetical protein
MNDDDDDWPCKAWTSFSQPHFPILLVLLLVLCADVRYVYPSPHCLLSPYVRPSYAFICTMQHVQVIHCATRNDQKNVAGTPVVATALRRSTTSGIDDGRRHCHD